jgi:hypothetical protein
VYMKGYKRKTKKTHTNDSTPSRTERPGGGLQRRDTASRSPGAQVLNNLLEHTTNRAECFSKKSCVPFLSQSLVHKNGEGVKIFPRLFGRSLPGLEPPIFSAQEISAREGEICLCPCSKMNPQLMSEAAVYKQVSAIFIRRRAKGTNWAMWPPSSSKVISQGRSPMGLP